MAFIKCSGGGKKYKIQTFPNVSSLGGRATIIRTYNDLSQVTCATGTSKWSGSYTRLIWSDDYGKTFRNVIADSYSPSITVNGNEVSYTNSDSSSCSVLSIFAIGF